MTMGRGLSGLVIVLLVSLLVLASQGTVLGDDNPGEGKGKSRKVGQSGENPPGWEHGKKEGWEAENPPGWKNWDRAKRHAWKDGLKRAKGAMGKAMEKGCPKRLEAALHALEMVARKGAPIAQAERMVKVGLKHGLGPFDFEPLGKFVVEKHQQGLRGEELSEAIHQESKRRKAEREKAQDAMKEKKSSEKAAKGKGKDKPGLGGADEGQGGKGKGPKSDDEKEVHKGRGRGKKK